MIPAIPFLPLLQGALALAGRHAIPLGLGALAALWVAVWSPPLSVPALRVPFTSIEIWDGQIHAGGYAARLSAARADLDATRDTLGEITLQLVSVTAQLEAEQRATAEAEEAVRQRQADSDKLAAALDAAETEAARLRRQITDQSNEEIADVAPEWAAMPVPDAVRAARVRRACARWTGAGIHHPACGSPPGDDGAAGR
ncbi:MAG: hypothetical protein ACXIVO_13635 [Glycocaulis sp.]